MEGVFSGFFYMRKALSKTKEDWKILAFFAGGKRLFEAIPVFFCLFSW